MSNVFTAENNNDRLSTLVMDYITHASYDLTAIKQFVFNEGIPHSLRPSLLYRAINYGSLPLVQLLVRYGANPLQPLPDQNTPFEIAARKARTQSNENDQMQIAMQYQKPEYKEVFLYLLKYLLTYVPIHTLSPANLNLALPLAIEFKETELARKLQDWKNKQS